MINQIMGKKLSIKIVTGAQGPNHDFNEKLLYILLQKVCFTSSVGECEVGIEDSYERGYSLSEG